MDPKTYATLYGPWQPPRQPVRSPAPIAVLAAALWAATLLCLAFVTFALCMVAVWAGAEGLSVDHILRPFALTVTGAAAALTALAFAPGVRRLRPAARLLLTGALAFPVPVFFAISMLAQMA